MRTITLHNIRMLVIVLAVLTVAGCGSKPELRPEQPYWKDNDTKSFPEPISRDPSLAWTSSDNTVFQQATELVDLDRDLRILFNNRKEADNINSVDEVPNSTWFTNRQGVSPMAPEEILRGGALTSGPDTSGTWALSRPKVGGATPGFWITDSRGDKYIIKFDPPENPEMATAATVMAARYFYACGYNVPQETIVYWSPEKIVLKDGLTYNDADGIPQPFTQETLNEILQQAYHTDEGLIRSSASMLIPNAKGPFSYKGKRNDDPNDWCPHQDRRELRALYVIGSWINHHDLKDHNTLDAFVETTSEAGYLKHYLLDFGSSFGSDGDNAKDPRKGYANWFDLRDVFVSTVTLGFKRWSWEKGEPTQYASIGYFESDIFEPNKFDPIVPNPAFENLTDRDAFWGAKIVMAFRDEHIRALVKAGEFSDPDAAEYLFQTLKVRREKIGRHWFSKVAPLDNFSLSANDGTLNIDFEDLSVKYGLESAGETRYRYRIHYKGKSFGEYRELSGAELKLDAPSAGELVSAYDGDEHLYGIDLGISRAGASRGATTTLWLWFAPETQDWKLVGIER